MKKVLKLILSIIHVIVVMAVTLFLLAIKIEVKGEFYPHIVEMVAWFGQGCVTGYIASVIHNEFNELKKIYSMTIYNDDKHDNGVITSPTKRRTPLQKLASNRNWAKTRILGFSGLNTKVFTDSELKIVQEIYKLRDELISSWDENNKELGLNVPEHRCYYCQREAKNRDTDGIWWCNKHFEL